MEYWELRMRRTGSTPRNAARELTRGELFGLAAITLLGLTAGATDRTPVRLCDLHHSHYTPPA